LTQAPVEGHAREDIVRGARHRPRTGGGRWLSLAEPRDWLVEVPASHMARTRSSTARVETPRMQASRSEPCRAIGPSDNGERHQRLLGRPARLGEGAPGDEEID
jgi:hypothetical protein